MARFRMPGSEYPATRRLVWMMAGDALTGIFGILTLFGPVFVLFLNALGLDKARIGVLLSVVPFCGLISILVAPLVTRWGFKRTAMIFWGTRHIFMALILLTPVVVRRYGLDAAFVWAACLTLAFGLFRGVAETAFNPWIQEVVPNAIRGKFGAVNSIIYTLAQMVAIAIASRYIEGGSGTARYMVLIGVASLIGASSVLCYALVPGGAAQSSGARLSAHLAGMRIVWHDRGYMLFLAAVGILTVALSTLSFVPLYMQEQVGLSAGSAISLSVASSAGAILSSYLWGWSADRFGSLPVMRWTILLLALLPIAWTLMPADPASARTLAFGVAFLQGAGTIGWQLGSQRYLFVYSSHSAQRVAFLTWCYVCSQFASGLGPLLAGKLLTITSGLSGRLLGLRLHPYVPLFAGVLALLAAGYLLVSRLMGDTGPDARPTSGL